MQSKKRYWFKAKLYGWGWYPATWEAWLILLIYIGLVVYFSHYRLKLFIPANLILTLVLIGISYLTGEKPRWRWGK